MRSLSESIIALDRLNSWVRVRDFGEPLARSVLRQIVYWLKCRAIRDASGNLSVTHERTMVPQPCRVCDQSGVFYSEWDSFCTNGEKCRTCNGTGIAKLRFVGTAIVTPDETVRWHTPETKWWSHSMDHYLGLPKDWSRALDDYAISTDDWKPNKRGKPMSREEVASAFNVIHDRWHDDVFFTLSFHRHLKPTLNPWVNPRHQVEQFMNPLFVEIQDLSPRS